MENKTVAVEFKLNYGLDGILPSGHVCDMLDLLKQMGELIQAKTLLVYRHPTYATEVTGEVIGIATSYRTDYDSVFIEALIDDPLIIQLIEDPSIPSLNITTGGVGNVTPDKKLKIMS